MKCERTAFFLLLFVCINMMQVQAQKTDSLVNVLSNYKKEDTVKLNLMNNLAWRYYIINPDKGIAIANGAIKLAQKLNDKKGLAKAYYNAGTNYGGKNDFEKVLEYRKQALNIYTAINDKDGMQHTLAGLASTYCALADYSKAIYYYQQSLHINEQLNNEKGLAEDYGGLGLVYLIIPDLPGALAYHQKALSIWQKRDDKPGMGYNLNCIARIYGNFHDYNKSMAFYKKALIVLRQTDDTTELISTLEGLGRQYHNLSNNDTAFTYYQQALSLSRQINYKNGMYVSLAGLGIIYPFLSDKFLIKKGEQPAKRAEKALAYLNQSLQIVVATKNIGFQMDTWQYISNFYEHQQNYQKAFEASKKYIMLRDSFLNDERKKEIEQLIIKYQFDEKQDSIKIQQKFKEEKAKQELAINKLKLQQQWFYSIGILILIALISFGFIYNNRLNQQRLKAELAKEKAVQERKDALFQRNLADVSLTALRSQMNPHFIFNCLNSIKLYTTQNDTEAASAYLSKFSKLIRLVMEESTKEKILLSSELNMLRLYIEMEAMRFKEKLQYNINVTKDVETDYIELPPMLLQPYVENAIWHGLMPKEEGGRIDITVAMNNDKSLLEITIADDGIGRVKSAGLQSKTATKHKSYGMKVTSERIALINQVYKTGADVTVHDLVDADGKTAGTKVIIQIPV